MSTWAHGAHITVAVALTGSPIKVISLSDIFISPLEDMYVSFYVSFRLLPVFRIPYPAFRAPRPGITNDFILTWLDMRGDR